MLQTIKSSKIIFLVSLLLSFSCSKNDSENIPKEEEAPQIINEVPSDFSLLAIENNATNIPPRPIFSWENSIDPESGPIHYNLLLGTTNPPETLYAENLSDASFTVTTSLDLSEKYFWRVEAIDNKNAITKSTTSTFATLDLQIPLTANVENADFPVRNGHGSVVFNNKIWVIGGSIGSYRNDVWSSSDGLNWELVTDNPGFSERTGFSLTVFENKIWLISGYAGFRTNDVWNSEDGLNWNQVTPNAAFPLRTEHTGLAFDNKLWVIGGSGKDGRLNDVWYSEDGLEWVMATDTADFPPRSDHASLVFDEKMWVIAGYLDPTGTDSADAWFSTDGVLWEKATIDSTIFPGRVSHFSTVFDGKMWVFGGFRYNGGGYRNDIWYSMDGYKWFEATSSGPFSKRSNSSGVVFDDKIWLFAGGRHLNISGTENTNDIWSFGKKTN